MEDINWRLVFPISLIAGAAYAGLTIAAVIQGYEHWVVLIFIGSIAKLIAVKAKVTPARNAFVAGFLFAIIALFFQALFLPVYFANNPEYASVPLPWGPVTNCFYCFVCACGRAVCRAAGVCYGAAVWGRRQKSLAGLGESS